MDTACADRTSPRLFSSFDRSHELAHRVDLLYQRRGHGKANVRFAIDSLYILQEAECESASVPGMQASPCMHVCDMF